MKFIPTHGIIVFCSLWSFVALGQDIEKRDLPGVVERHAMIPMRDGIKLSAYLYFPDPAFSTKVKLPVVFEQRYASLTGAATRKNSADLARHGFVVAMVNFRGTQLSEGKYVGYRALGWGEQKDGYDICEWLAVQPWSSGKVGSFGSSQGGFAQNFLAVVQPPHLVCQYMVDTGLSLFHEGYRIGGVTRPKRFAEMSASCRDPNDNIELLNEWDRHPIYDAYWQAEDCTRHFDQMNVPCFTMGSWYDFMIQGSIQSFQGRNNQGGLNSRGKQQLVLGPWLHGRLNKGNKIGELDYPANAIWPELDHMVRWFDHWLKGEENGIEKEPAVRYYVMGACGEVGAPGNLWRSAMDFPPHAKSIRMHFHADSKLHENPPNEESSGTDYECDPLRPMEIPGRAFPGARDARAFESQAQVRSWTTDRLDQPLEITGEIKADIWIQSSAPDADLILRVSDVYPDGRSMLLMDYPIRARYRDGFDRESLLTPDTPTKLSWHIGWTSIILNRGHRLRITISSTGAPLYEPNNQLGDSQGINWLNRSQVAKIKILHDAKHPSSVTLPVLSESIHRE